ncbi:hypothetical protein EDC04DRAFT_434375 [Pisolithus marmoratus]|nr:hypothetical protein EDC04DRAFT_434375 [Pisolithus marmoratus]
MSMNITCHRAFDELVLWLKRVGGLRDTYHVREVRQGIKRANGIPDTVTFSTETEYALPQPALLALYCEVAWMFGAAEHIVDVERMMDQTRVLAKDGSIAECCRQRWHFKDCM